MPLLSLISWRAEETAGTCILTGRWVLYKESKTNCDKITTSLDLGKRIHQVGEKESCNVSERVGRFREGLYEETQPSILSI